MRNAVPALLFLLATAPAARALAAEPVPDATAISQLEHKAEQADPRERSFLYTELAHFYAEIASQQMAAGEVEQAAASLKQVEHCGALIHEQLNHDSKRLKNSEMLMHETTHRLTELAHFVSAEDRETVQTTLRHLNQVNEEILAQVFAH